MTLNLPLLYWFWLAEYCQTSPNKNKSPNLWQVTSILVCCIFGSNHTLLWAHCSSYLFSLHTYIFMSMNNKQNNKVKLITFDNQCIWSSVSPASTIFMRIFFSMQNKKEACEILVAPSQKKPEIFLIKSCLSNFPWTKSCKKNVHNVLGKLQSFNKKYMYTRSNVHYKQGRKRLTKTGGWGQLPPCSPASYAPDKCFNCKLRIIFMKKINPHIHK